MLRLLAENIDVKKTLYKLACGKFDSSPFGNDFIEKGRKILATELAARGVGGCGTAPAAGQTVMLKELGGHLRLSGDPDWRIMDTAKDSYLTGTAVGVAERLPRTPAVFERKTKFRKYDEIYNEDNLPESRENYRSVIGLVDEIEKQFKEEEAEGLMIEVEDGEARREYGDKLVVAALGALQKSDTSFRVIFDGTHGIKVNPRIHPRDQLRMPGMAEQSVILGLCRARGGVHFGLTGDVKKAHRRCRIRRQDQGYQACRIRDGSVWINGVGTFGIGSAAYWWGRLAAALSRSALYIMFREWFWQLLFADDFNWTSSGGDAANNLVLTVFWYEILGVIFSWKKFMGGLQVDCVGFWTDYEKFTVCLSGKRGRWIIDWLQGLLCDGHVLVQRVADGLRRLSFGALAVPGIKPFLGPFYAWCSAVPTGAYVVFPIVLRIIAKFLIMQIKTAGFTRECWDTTGQVEEECFRADAKAEGEDVGIGGWECRGNKGPSEARWFSIKVMRQSFPWVFARGEPFRLIASLEFLGTLMCWMVFGSSDSCPLPGMIFGGSTDNKGNSHVVDRVLTTKFPPLCSPDGALGTAGQGKQIHDFEVGSKAPKHRGR